MSVIGHNNGPAMGQGRGWRTYCWRAARRELLPHMPLNVVRRRVKRAAELGLAYPAYARIHATTGRDILAFLFSTNALQIIRDTDPLPGDRAEFLNAQQACATLSLAHPPLEPDSVARRLSLATGREVTARRAPPAIANWAEVRAAVRAPALAVSLPADSVLVVGDTSLERDWCAAAAMAGYLSADQIFAQPI